MYVNNPFQLKEIDKPCTIGNAIFQHGTVTYSWDGKHFKGKYIAQIFMYRDTISSSLIKYVADIKQAFFH